MRISVTSDSLDIEYDEKVARYSLSDVCDKALEVQKQFLVNIEEHLIYEQAQQESEEDNYEE